MFLALQNRAENWLGVGRTRDKCFQYHRVCRPFRGNVHILFLRVSRPLGPRRGKLREGRRGVEEFPVDFLSPDVPTNRLLYRYLCVRGR